MKSSLRRILLVLGVMTLGFVAGCRKDEPMTTGASASASSSAAAASTPAAPSAEPAQAPAEPSVNPAASTAVPPEPESPIPDIPEGRSKPPTAHEWSEASELNTQEPNSQAENCQMKVVREWLKVYCHGDVTAFSDMTEFGEKSRDYFVSLRKGKSADFVVRLRQGKTMKLKIQRNDAREAVLYVSWPHDKPKPAHIALGRGKPPEPAKKDESKGAKGKKGN